MICRKFHVVDKGSLFARVSVEIPAWHMTIECLWFKKDEHEWIGLPSEKLPSGKYRPLISFTDESVRDRFQTAALEAAKKLVSTQA